MNTLENVKQWFIDRDLENGGRLDKQSLKLSEEFGELCAGYLKKNEKLTKDSIGDCAVVIVGLALLIKVDVQEVFEGFTEEFKQDTSDYLKDLNGCISCFQMCYDWEGKPTWRRICMIPKFRAWDKELQTMLDVSLIDFKKRVLVGEHWKFGETNFMSFDEIELMQSTGLKDKNGKEIFEGDIVRQVRTQPTTENETITGLVTMLEGAWLIMNDCEQLASFLWSETDENEIIGNIYENPELLEDK